MVSERRMVNEKQKYRGDMQREGGRLVTAAMTPESFPYLRCHPGSRGGRGRGKILFGNDTTREVGTVGLHYYYDDDY